MLPVSEKDPWKSALSAAALRYQCEWPHKGSFAPNTNLKGTAALFPKRCSSTMIRRRFRLAALAKGISEAASLRMQAP